MEGVAFPKFITGTLMERIWPLPGVDGGKDPVKLDINFLFPALPKV